MTQKFKQYHHGQALLLLLESKSRVIVGSVLDTLTELEAFEETESVAKNISQYWEDPELCVKALKYLGQAGDKDRDTNIIERFLLHPEYSVRFEAVRALKKLNTDNNKMTELSTQDPALNRIIRHQSEALLQ